MRPRDRLGGYVGCSLFAVRANARSDHRGPCGYPRVLSTGRAFSKPAANTFSDRDRNTGAWGRAAGRDGYSHRNPVGTLTDPRGAGGTDADRLTTDTEPHG